MDKSISIWNTVECDCWSRDFNYENYCMFHDRVYADSSNQPAKLCKEAYVILCDVFHTHMINDKSFWPSDRG